MREPGQITGDTVLASWRAPRTGQQRTTNRQVPRNRLRAAPIAFAAESGGGTPGVGANRVAATWTGAFTLADAAGIDADSIPAAVAPGPRAPAGQRGCRFLRRFAVQ